MAYDMIEAMTLIAREKNIEFDSVVETLEAALMAAAKKKYEFTDNISFRFDKKNNEMVMMATKKVVEEIADSNIEMSLVEAKEIFGWGWWLGAGGQGCSCPSRGRARGGGLPEASPEANWFQNEGG